MGEHRDPLSHVGRRHERDHRPDPIGELGRRFGSGDHVPPLLGEHPQRDRVLLGKLLAVETALPLSHEHLAQIAFDPRGDTEGARQGSGGLDTSSEGTGVDGVDVLAGQPGADQLRLRSASRGERGVSLPVGQRERRAPGHRTGFAVAHQEHIGRPGRGDELDLAELTLVRHGTKLVALGARPLQKRSGQRTAPISLRRMMSSQSRPSSSRISSVCSP